MPEPSRGKKVAVKCALGNQYEYIKLINHSRSEDIVKVQLNASKEAVHQADDWEEGDEIQAEIEGRVVGVSRGKIKGGGLTLSITAVADTSSVAVDI